jgi:hypothetical protein
MKVVLTRVMLALVLIGLGVGINVTYESYRGTGLSSVPELGPRRLEAAQSQTSDSPAQSRSETSSKVAARPDAPAVRPDLAALRSAVVSELTLYPTLAKGMRTPFDLWRYYGRGVSSFSSPILPMRFEQWLEFHRKQKPSLMQDIRNYMAMRFDFSGSALPEATMSGGKSVMAGPVARLSDKVASYEALAKLTPEEVRERDLFPYKPLAHPLQTVAHMVFPESWIKVHPRAPSHRRRHGFSRRIPARISATIVSHNSQGAGRCGERSRSHD